MNRKPVKVSLTLYKWTTRPPSWVEVWTKETTGYETPTQVVLKDPRNTGTLRLYRDGRQIGGDGPFYRYGYKIVEDIA